MLSVVVPLYNEEGNIGPLIASLREVLDRLSRKYEILLVNDGSSDGTETQLRELALNDRRIKAINFSRNFGQTAAIMAGIEYASGDVIIPMDGDLQNDPSDIPKLLDKLDEGYDVVSGWRKDRRDAPIKRAFLSRVANRLISWTTGIHLHDYGCTMKAYRRDIIKGVRIYGEMHRFIPVYASWQGGRVAEIPVTHRPRVHGKSHYGLNRVLKVLLDLVVVEFLARYASRPIYIFGGFGVLCFVASLCAGVYAVILKLFYATSFIQTPLPLLVVMLFITGVMLILMGLLAEMVMRTYFESQGKPPYVVKSSVNTS